jgi:hypothetical protein
VKGEAKKLTLAKAVLISPIISERLKSDPTNRIFHFESEEVSPQIFSAFIEMIASREKCVIDGEQALGFLSISKLLGNEMLSLLFLCSSKSNICERILSSEMKIYDKNFGDEYELCASQFTSYSTNELRNLPKQTLHRLLSSKSLVIENEDDLLQRLLDLGSDYFEFLDYIKVSFLSDTGISRFVEVVSFDNLSSMIWSKIVSRMKGICDDDHRKHRCRCVSESGGLSHIRYKDSICESRILSVVPGPLKQFEEKEWVLIYRGRRDGFESSRFHSKCGGQVNTVTIILTPEQYIFGGFTPIA